MEQISSTRTKPILHFKATTPQFFLSILLWLGVRELHSSAQALYYFSTQFARIQATTETNFNQIPAKNASLFSNKTEKKNFTRST